MSALVEICGILDKVIFQSPENGFTVAHVRINAQESFTVRGHLPVVHQGEQVTLKGSWVYHQKFGRQFEVKECVKQLPSSVEGIRKYLSSGLIKGIGRTYAKSLVAHFGAQTLEVIDKEPNKLFEVSGIGAKRVSAITQAWQEQKEISCVMVFLQEKDISVDFAVKIFKTYGHESIAKIQENPYRLSEDIYGIGFKSADKVALKLGFDVDSHYRVQAGIVHCITEEINNGHLYCRVADVKEKVPKLLDLEEHEHSDALLSVALRELYERKRIVLISQHDQHYLSLPKYYYSEKGVASKIHRLKDYKGCSDRFDFEKVYASIRLPSSKGMALNEDQQRGILSCLQSKVSIITGGPGTGKTTLIRRLLDVLERYKIRYRLAAPTGRAAKRIFEGTGRGAETLHRLLSFSPATMGFTKNEDNALNLNFLIIDEASMIDVFLMHAILRALPLHAHLVLIGDVDQLPSVGAGNILHDLIESSEVAVARLTEIFRQAQDSLIVVNAHRINKGEFPVSSLPGSRNDFIFLKESEPENFPRILHHLYTRTLKKRGVAPHESIVLAPMNRGTVGAHRINQELQQILNPSKEGRRDITRFGQFYRVGDPVMQIRNNYEKYVFNGDMGFIETIDHHEHHLMIRFGERLLIYDFSELIELVLAYAISIHKSQGSEFKAVIVPVFMQHFIMLQRNLLYTALTRAKELCIFVGQPKAIAMGIKNNKGVRRSTFLAEFLTTDLQAR